MFSDKHNKYTCEGCIENPDCATCKQHCFEQVQDIECITSFEDFEEEQYALHKTNRELEDY